MKTDSKKVTKAIESTISPRIIREVLNIDNSQIQELCKTASIKPKKDSRGLTYFTKDDLETMKNFAGSKNNLPQAKLSMLHVQKEETQVAQKTDSASMVKFVESLKNLEKSITDKVSTIMDEKLDGMDDVVVELIRCKTENETLRFKINELNKENYNLKNELTSYKNVALNVYVKKNTNA